MDATAVRGWLVRPITFLVAVLAATPLSTVNAQDSPQVKPGDRVRVTAPYLGIRKQAGRFETRRGDTLVVAAPDSTMMFPVVFVMRLEVSRGRKSAVGRGALIGFLVGAGGGAIAGAAALSEGCVDGDGCPALGALVGGAFFGLVGTGIGAVVGALSKAERWEEVPLDQLRVAFAPQRDGRFGLVLSVGF